MTQRIAVGLTLLAALFLTACGEDPPPKPTEATLAFRAQPQSVRAGERLGTVEVAFVDASGAVLTERGGSVQLTLEGAPAGTQLGGTTRAQLTSGVARFTDLTVTASATGMKLRASLNTYAATSEAFAVRAAPASRLALTSGPTDVDVGGTLPPLTVALQDAYGNTPEEAVAVKVSLAGGNPAATLSGNTTAQTVNGTATFTELAVDEDGDDYVLVFSGEGLTEARSAAFKVRPGVPTSLSFTAQPAASTVAGATLTPVTVSVLDARGKVAKRATGNVSVELVAANGAVLKGTGSVAVVNGVATFNTLSVEKAGTGYTLRAGFGTLTTVDSTSFAITAAAAARLAYVVAPGAATVHSAITPAVQVELLDAYGNRPGSTATVTVALAANPGQATLGGTLSVAAVAGLATFSDLTVDAVGTGYTLAASSDGLDTVTSGAFNVAHGTPAAVVFLEQPTNIAAGEPITPVVRVAVNDAFGNRVTTATGNVSLALGNNPGTATLTGATQVALVNGEATFPGVSVSAGGTGFTLSASFGTVTSAASNAFNVAPAAVALAFVAAPGNITAGVAFTPVVAVELRDASGNRTASRATVTLRLASNPAGASLVGTASATAVNGLAEFPGLTVQRAGTGYTVEAVSGTLPVVASAAFNVANAAIHHFTVTTQPVETVVAGESTGTIVVEARDAFENRVPTFSAIVRAGVDYDENPNGASVVAGTRQATPVNGVATFTGLALDKAGATQFVFVCTSPFILGYSRPVNVTPAAPAAIAFRQVPEQAQAGSALGPAVQVAVTDRFGNATGNGSGNVTLALAANPGGDTLRGTLTAAVTGGVATFADLVLQKAAAGYTLKASLTGMTPVTSNPFTVVGAEATRVAFQTQPRSTPSGLPLNEVAVRLVDAFGNTATSTSEVTLALGNASGAVLGGTLTVAARGGVASFAGLTVDRLGEDYSLQATSGTLTGAESNAFDVYGATLAYTDPTTGRIRVLRNAASTDTRVVLDVVAAEELTGYGVGFNLPVDASKVRLAAQNAITAGAILSTGSSVPAVAVALPTAGPMAGVLTSGISQKAAGSGAVQTDTVITAGSVLYQLVLELAPGAEPGVVFDGANAGSGFKGLLRNKLGDDVVGSSGFTVGRLEIASDAALQKTAAR
ncbi:beta strand repeat-containing protein [Pyxidicoccus xibeiensis]|uniref:beta strand repeat-containing protein n=1 Tax=Pyxidicoccus xibeiensis TaxID=2906759 RepID=UPI0020A7D036|nr:hypothetical protein [Pyxidicoccus xibeiensis]MCP3136490.1 hypothetical protein [Pyxidicoccus xibeiensis]